MAKYRMDDSKFTMDLGETEKEKAIKFYRREASRKAALANKRIERLERNNLIDSPAYKKYIEDGKVKFSVKGKTYNELQKEVARMERFINSKSSTVKGATTLLKQLADNTGIKYKNLKDLRAKAPKFFELSSKVEQYLRTVEDRASAIGYQKIWEAVNLYVKKEEVDLSDSELDLDSMITAITRALNEFETPLEAGVIGGESFNWYKVKD